MQPLALPLFALFCSFFSFCYCDLFGGCVNNCTDGKGCYSYYKKCNGYADCSDKSDEDENMCKNDECYFTLTQSKCADEMTCIFNWDVCDGVIDCPDGSDEHNCKDKTCPPGYSKCADGLECIDDDLFCNLENNCKDKSDEHGCEDRPCDNESQKCRDRKQCVPEYMFCDLDGISFCGDGSDEDPEFCRDFTCPDYMVKGDDGIRCQFREY